MTSLQQRNPRRGRLHQKFIGRAQYLKSAKAYRDGINDLRDQWDRLYPAFAVGVPGYPPEIRPRYADLGVPYPFRLHDEFVAINRRVQLRDLTPTPLESAAYTAEFEWNQRIEALCEEWWPNENFPFSGPSRSHPARTFVAACVLWRIELIPEDWIDDPARGLWSVPFNPTDSNTIPAVVEFRTAWFSLLDRLGQLFSDSDCVTSDSMSEIVTSAARDGFAARDAMYENNHDIAYLALRLHPRMTRLEWERLYPGIAAHMQNSPQFQGRNVRERARQLEAEGVSKEQIAKSFGVDPSTITKWLAGDDSA